MVYDNDLQTVLRGYENNEALIPHIWEILCSNSVKNTANDMHPNDPRLPRLHQDWLSREDMKIRE